MRKPLHDDGRHWRRLKRTSNNQLGPSYPATSIEIITGPFCRSGALEFQSVLQLNFMTPEISDLSAVKTKDWMGNVTLPFTAGIKIQALVHNRAKAAKVAHLNALVI